RLRRVGRVEEAELDLGGILRKEGEIDALAVPGRPEWIRIPWPYAHSAASVCEVRGPRWVLCGAVLMRSRSLVKPSPSVQVVCQNARTPGNRARHRGVRPSSITPWSV